MMDGMEGIVDEFCYVRGKDKMIYIPEVSFVPFLTCGRYRRPHQLWGDLSRNRKLLSTIERRCLTSAVLDDLWSIWLHFFKLAKVGSIVSFVSRSGCIYISQDSLDAVIGLGVADAVDAYFDGVPIEDIIA